jgi:cobalt-zinc-cadmium efflux system membrane fusion protein
MRSRRFLNSIGTNTTLAVVLVASIFLAACSHKTDSGATTGTVKMLPATGGGSDTDTVSLNDTQLKSIEVGKTEEHQFSLQRTAVGSIDFNENLAVPVFSNYQGKIIQAFSEIGDEVKKGQTLYTIDSPDLDAAESTLISAAGVYELTTAALARDRKVFIAKGIAQKDLDQAISDQQAAEGALNAARDAVRIFGKSEIEINKIISTRKVDPVLAIVSPISGRVTARMAQPGLLVQPGNLPAPYSVADVSTMWMLANVAETDSPLFRIGQAVRVKVMAFPDHDFSAKIARIGATVDPNTHTVVVRSEVHDPRHELRPGMLATYVINTGAPTRSVAVPADGIVREGDGTMTAWVTTDGHHFTRRTVKIGLRQDGFDQIMDGLKLGESIVTKNAVFVSNMLNGSDQS